MIPVFTKLKELIATVPAIKWVDLDKGQIDHYEFRPALPFPSALLRINVTRTDDLGGGVQRCWLSCNVRLVFDYSGDTNNHVPASALTHSLEFFNITEAVFKAIHYKGNAEIGKFMRKGQTQEQRTDGLTVINLPFETIYTDKSAAV
ncbi:MAG: hypothetical protein EOO42_01075 [Flavobacteriales bacterium]|nr:MAG: hypothetical protein EOO42_01075 [Flavobacteriales bacterium]